MQHPALRIRLTLKGRLIRDYEFTQPIVHVGRDPEADLCLDNIGVSRSHARFEWTEEGWILEDSGSANGTFVNDARTDRARIRHRDIVTIGKFSLGVGLGPEAAGDAQPAQSRTQSERFEQPAAPAHREMIPDAVQGTTVLTRGQLARMLAGARESQPGAPEMDPMPLLATGSALEVESLWRRWGLSGLVVLVAIAVGFVIGALVR